jgi:outer membrane protein OmpA-like peptidoglycan-associated protein/WD40 repeat protein
MHRLLVVLGVLSSMPATAFDLPSNYKGKSPGELFGIAYRVKGRSTKAILRRYLAQVSPETPEGLFSNWILTGIDRPWSEEAEALRACRTKAPTFLYCFDNAWINSHDAAASREAVDAYEHVLATDPSFDDYAALRNEYFELHDDLHDVAKADALLARWEPQVRHSAVVEMIKGIQANADGNHQEAQKQFESGIIKDPRNLELRTRLVDLRLEKSDTTTPADKRAELLGPVVDFIRSEEGRPDPDPFKAAAAWAYLGDKLKTIFKANGEAFEAYSRAFAAYPTGEVAEQLYAILNEQDGPRARQLLLQANAAIPDNYLVLRALGKAFAPVDPVQAKQYFARSVAQSPLREASVAAAVAMGQKLYEEVTLDYDAALSLYQEQLKGGSESDLVGAVYFNRRGANDSAAALDWLRKHPTLGTAQWRADNEQEMERFLSLQKHAEAFDTAHPFLREWRKRFGDAARVSLNFAEGSAALPADADAVLRPLADAMHQPGGDQYVYRIEGHTDGAGHPDANRKLSLERARSVAAYLHDHLQIDDGRLITAGYGSDFPLAPDTTEGRARNRRVEIAPLGSLEQATLSVTGALDASDRLAVSDDGRLAAVGATPMQLWDTQRKIRIRDLGRGGLPRAFSPNGRFLAAASNFEEPGGFRSKVLYIYDVKTGEVRGQIAEFWTIEALAWSPGSDQVAWVNGNGRLNVYDLTHNRQTHQIPLAQPGVRGRGLVWTRDGRYLVTGQVDDHGLQVFDGASFQQVRTLTGSRWTHALGQTADGRYVLCADNQRTLTAWDTAKDWSFRQMLLPVLGGEIVAHPFEPKVLVTDWGGKDHNQVVLIDLATMKVVASHDTGSELRSVGFGPGGASVYVTDGAAIAVLNSRDLKEIERLDGPAAHPRAAVGVRSKGLLVTADDEGTHIWNVASGHRIRTWKIVVDGLFETGGSEVVGLRYDRSKGQSHFTRIDLDKLDVTPLITVDYRVDSVDSNPTEYVLAGVPFPVNDRAGPDATVAVFNRKTLAQVREAHFPVATEYLKWGFMDHTRLVAFAARADGKAALVTTAWGDGWRNGETESRVARLVDLTTGEILRTFDGAAGHLEFARPDGGTILITNDRETELIETATGKRLETRPRRSGEGWIALPDGSSIVWSSDFIRHQSGAESDRMVPLPDNAVAVDTFPALRRLVVFTHANELVFHDLATFEKRLTIATRRDKQWFAFSPENHFVASPGGVDRVAWSVGDLQFDFDRWSEGAFKGNLLEKALGH